MSTDNIGQRPEYILSETEDQELRRGLAKVVNAAYRGARSEDVTREDARAATRWVADKLACAFIENLNWDLVAKDLNSYAYRCGKMRVIAMRQRPRCVLSETDYAELKRGCVEIIEAAYRGARGAGASPEDAEEVANSVAHKLSWIFIRELDWKIVAVNLTAFACRCGQLAAISINRRETRRPTVALVAETVVVEKTSPAKEAEDRELHRSFRETLGPDLRQVFDLLDTELTENAIGDFLGISRRAVQHKKKLIRIAYLDFLKANGLDD